jgi:hypothetical protein
MKSADGRYLVGALSYIRAEFDFRGDGTLDLLHQAIPREQSKRTPVGGSIPNSLRPYHS